MRPLQYSMDYFLDIGIATCSSEIFLPSFLSFAKANFLICIFNTSQLGGIFGEYFGVRSTVGALVSPVGLFNR